MSTEENVILVQINGSISWVVDPADEHRVELAGSLPLTLLHPAFFPHQQIPLGDGTFMAHVALLAFVTPAERLDDEGVARVEVFLRNLRHQARQPELPVEVVCCSSKRVVVESRPQIAATEPGSYRFQRYILQTAVRNHHVQAAARRPASLLPPIYEELYLQAVRAARERDERKAVLYSAIAIESCAQEVTRAKYDSDRSANGPETRQAMRFVDFTTHSGVVRKDPVFAFLVDRARFGTWLHELPLYVLGRSMLQHDQELYTQAMALSRARNVLAHSGQAVDDESATPLMGALDAVQIAGRCLAWFGASGNILDPTLGFTVAAWAPVGSQG